MSKSAIYAVNTSTQNLDAGDTIALNTIVRRYGCNTNLYNNGVKVSGTGYYEISADVVAVPSAAGTVSATLLKDGVPVTGATASATVAATATSVTLSINAIVRETCCCDSSSVLTLALGGASAAISNVAMVVEKL